GDMAELGELTETAHEKIGILTKELEIDQVIAIGVKAKRLAENATETALWFASVPEALAAIDAAFTPGSAMLVKASHSMHFEQIVKEFSKEQA
ncbi:MAG: UDP-N-acetylmuramoyl-tripeptide--D-alanyl-D-alanine ligase, partial [Oscillospiraceae bacterium]|nr:UDP-N-acetylmuramoyl-tripeptide--D-alanyl-D-alanine ligase [Oscillospiraceae bacterium]